MVTPQLTFATRKALCVQLGEPAGNEVTNRLQHLLRRIDELERGKVDTTPTWQGSGNGGPLTLQRVASPLSS